MGSGVGCGLVGCAPLLGCWSPPAACWGWCEPRRAAWPGLVLGRWGLGLGCDPWLGLASRGALFRALVSGLVSPPPGVAGTVRGWWGCLAGCAPPRRLDACSARLRVGVWCAPGAHSCALSWGFGLGRGRGVPCGPGRVRALAAPLSGACLAGRPVRWRLGWCFFLGSSFLGARPGPWAVGSAWPGWPLLGLLALASGLGSLVWFWAWGVSWRRFVPFGSSALPLCAVFGRSSRLWSSFRCSSSSCRAPPGLCFGPCFCSACCSSACLCSVARCLLARVMLFSPTC